MTVLAFPLARRRDLILRQAAWFAEQPHGAAERNLCRQLEVQRDTLLRRGVEAAIARAQVRSLEAAIRAEVARLHLSRGLGA